MLIGDALCELLVLLGFSSCDLLNSLLFVWDGMKIACFVGYG